MYTIRMHNEISANGLGMLPKTDYTVSSDAADADAILVRSANLHDLELPKNLKAIARAGAGVNNIPIEICNERGIVVFNTPGANANSVKELVLASLLLSSRRIYQGISWSQTLSDRGDEVAKSVERGKSQFVGPELKGKRLGIIGLGAIGVLVAGDALALGMDVIGYDPYISVEGAWGLSSQVAKATSLEEIYSTCDYITLHVPQNEKTKSMLATPAFDLMKPGVRIINLARGGLVNNTDLLKAIQKDIVACFVTDFPTAELLGNDRIIPIPHLGASTPESEENCAAMAVSQLREFLEKGNIVNSVNFPSCKFVATQGTRLVIAHANIPNMVGQITGALAAQKLNITELLNQHRDTLAYTIVDVEGNLEPALVTSIKAIEGVRSARVI